MAFIICQSCGRKISDKAPNCPFCRSRVIHKAAPVEAGDNKVCLYCAETIKKQAIRCCHCGADLTPQTTTPGQSQLIFQLLAGVLKVAVGLILLVLLANIFLWPDKMPETKTDPAPRNLKIEAYTVCGQFVQERLKAPSSADFPWYSEEYVSVRGETYWVSSYVDSQNSFGAKIRSHYICEVTPGIGELWDLKNVVFR